jgi:hypothetical protein
MLGKRTADPSTAVGMTKVAVVQNLMILHLTG